MCAASLLGIFEGEYTLTAQTHCVIILLKSEPVRIQDTDGSKQMWFGEYSDNMFVDNWGDLNP
jgi:hypothetical protein